MIGDVIKELRKERDISQALLAKNIGVSQKAIDYWERGVNEPKASYIIKLADFFGVSADFCLAEVFEWYVSPSVFFGLDSH